jgi:hypothetical protein
VILLSLGVGDEHASSAFVMLSIVKQVAAGRFREMP